MRKSWWYCFTAYWKRNWDVDAQSTYVYFRTPMFAIGYYRNAYQQDRDGRWSGWKLCWIPSSWTLAIPESGYLYRHNWDNLKAALQLVRAD